MDEGGLAPLPLPYPITLRTGTGDLLGANDLGWRKGPGCLDLRVSGGFPSFLIRTELSLIKDPGAKLISFLTGIILFGFRGNIKSTEFLVSEKRRKILSIFPQRR